MQWLLDTNARITLLKSASAELVSRLAERQDGDVLLCSVVKGELWHGAHKYAKREVRLARLEELFDRHRSLPFDDEAAWHYADIRHFWETTGQVIGPNDLKIAAICRANHLRLVTNNVGEFRRVPGLEVEDWTIPIDQHEG